MGFINYIMATQHCPFTVLKTTCTKRKLQETIEKQFQDVTMFSPFLRSTVLAFRLSDR